MGRGLGRDREALTPRAGPANCLLGKEAVGLGSTCRDGALPLFARLASADSGHAAPPLPACPTQNRSSGPRDTARDDLGLTRRRGSGVAGLVGAPPGAYRSPGMDLRPLYHPRTLEAVAYVALSWVVGAIVFWLVFLL